MERKAKHNIRDISKRGYAIIILYKGLYNLVLFEATQKGHYIGHYIERCGVEQVNEFI